MEETPASKILATLSAVTKDDLKVIDNEILALRDRLSALTVVRNLIARAVGEERPLAEKASKDSPTKKHSPDLEPERRRLARVLMARGGGMTRLELCQATGTPPATNRINTLLNHAWFDRDSEGIYRITMVGRQANGD